MIKLCIFDLDGTIADTLEDLACSMNFALQKNGFSTHLTDSYRTFVGDGVLKLIERASGCGDSDAIARIKSDFDEYYHNHSTDNTKAYSGCRDMLEKLKNTGIDIAVYSNKPHEFVSGILNKLYPDIKFAFALGKQADFPPKPCPDGLLYQTSQMGINPEECLYIGDSNVDIYTAQNAKMYSCGVAWGFRGEDELKNAGADYVIFSPEEIFGAIERIKK